MAELALLGGRPLRREPFPPWPQGDEREAAQLQKVLASGRWFAGPRGDDPQCLGVRFGERFAAWHGAGHGIAVANGSAAIEIALRALDLRLGDEVIVPAYTFLSTATSVLLVGGVPVFADLDPVSYCLDPADAARRITERTRVILPVHLGGHLADMKAINQLAQSRGLRVVEDCAQAIGASWGEQKVGAWGDLGTFSFQANKTITAGEGGLILTSSGELAEKVQAYTAFGRFKRSGEPAARSSALLSSRLSGNYRLSEFQAAVLLAQMEKFPQQQTRRQANAQRLTKGLAGLAGIEHVSSGDPALVHGYYYYLLHYQPDEFGGLSPQRLAQALNAEGLPFVPGDAQPIYGHPVFSPASLEGVVCPEVLARFREVNDLGDPGCPAAEEACRSTLILRHQVLLASPQDMDDLIAGLHKIKEHVQELL